MFALVCYVEKENDDEFYEKIPFAKIFRIELDDQIFRFEVSLAVFVVFKRRLRLSWYRDFA